MNELYNICVYLHNHVHGALIAVVLPQVHVDTRSTSVVNKESDDSNYQVTWCVLDVGTHLTICSVVFRFFTVFIPGK